MLSADVAERIADMGFSFKLRGNEDMLLGLWMRLLGDHRAVSLSQ